MSGTNVVHTPSHRAEPRRDHQRRMIVPLTVLGLLWSLVVSRPTDHVHLDRERRSILSLDWADLALRARAAQPPTISNSPAR